MAILQNRMSTIVMPDDYFPPDDVLYGPMISYEAGPIALNNPSEGQKYQDWVLTYSDPLFTLTPQTTGSPTVLPISVPEVIQLGLAFDQNGHEAICYNTQTNGYLYWWDSSVPGFVTTDFGTDYCSLVLTLDDKRARQTQVNDIILWYTKLNGLTYDLFNRVQRERFEDETLMASGMPKYIAQVGMHEGYRLQVTFASKATTPIIPPGPPIPQANLDFELGDVYWEKTNDFTIDQTDPYAGTWSAILNTIPANYSTLENSVYTAVTPSTPLFVSCQIKGSIATAVTLGFKFYNAAKSLLSTYIVSRNVTIGWTQIDYSVASPSDAVYFRIFVESNATDGIVSMDNFNMVSAIYFDVELATDVYFDVELATTKIFEVEL